MESEDEKVARLEAQAQLQTLDHAMGESVAASVHAHSARTYAGISLIGPALVFWITAIGDFDQVGTSEERVLRISAVLLGLAAIVVLLRAGIAERRHPVRQKAPAFGGRTTKWAFAAIMCVTMPLTIGMNIVTINDVYSPYLIGFVVFAIMAGGQYYFWNRHIDAMGRRP